MTHTPLFRPTQTRSVRTALLLAVALTAIAGCGKKTNAVNPPNPGPTATTTPPAPPASLTADPLAIDLGQSIVLNWRTTDATAVTIDGIGPVNVNGTQTVSPSSST